MATLATKTVAAINAALELDQGATYRRLLGENIMAAGDAYNPRVERFRNHLGASLLGRDCAREIWYSFRWTTEPHFKGQILRLFNRGHLEEPRFIALLLMIGCEVWQVDANGKQFRMTGGYRGHFGGSSDGVIRGIPDLPNEPVLGEFKTHNDKSFTKLVDEGVMKAKWEHFVQMQCYMGDFKLRYALYLAVNKNNDEIYGELVAYDPQQDERYKQRAIMLVDATEAPARISNSPGWFKCKFCDHSKVCHDTALPVVTCRSCNWVKLADGGKWLCTHPEAGQPSTGIALTSKQQETACDAYQLNPTFKARP